MRTLGRHSALLLILASCAPTLPPFLVAETAEVLPPGQLAVTAGGGGTLLASAGTAGLCCGGGELRARAGVGSGQEVSVTTAVAGTGGVWALDAKGGWKLALAPWAAVMAGADVLLNDDGGHVIAAPGGELGAIFSTPATGRFHHVQLYGGARVSLHVPALPDPFAGPGTVFDASLPAGLAIHTSPATRLFLEGGVVALGTWTRATQGFESYPFGGAYGAIAFEVVFR